MKHRMWIAPSWSTAFRQMGLIAVQSTRHGGVSPAPWASLNLGLHTADDPERVRANRRRFFDALGVDVCAVAGGHQVHGAEVAVVAQVGQYDGCDAFVSNQPGLLLTVTVADCVPVLLFDPKRQVVAAAHAGWRGTVQQVAARTVQAMHHRFGCQPADLYVWIGASIGFEQFEVGPEVARHFAQAHKKQSKHPGKWLVDLKAANRAQLEACGVPSNQIEVSYWCTAAHNYDFFSHRKEGGRTGRMLAAIGWGFTNS